MHKIGVLALFVKTAPTVPFTVFYAGFWLFLCFSIKKLAFKALYDTLNDQFL
jgi:hypothetical protein